LIALHLSSEEWTTESCRLLFKQICSRAFAHKQLRIMPAISWKQATFSNHKYHAQGLQSALKEAFTETRTLYDAPDGLRKGDIALKIAMLAKPPASTMLFTNYRHHQSAKGESPPEERKKFRMSHRSSPIPSVPARRPVNRHHCLGNVRDN